MIKFIKEGMRDLNVDRYPGRMDPDDNPPGYDEAVDAASEIIDRAQDGELIPMGNGMVLRWEDFGDGDGQYLLGSEESVMDQTTTDAEVFPNDDAIQDFLVDKIMKSREEDYEEFDMMESLKESVKSEIKEKLKILIKEELGITSEDAVGTALKRTETGSMERGLKLVRDKVDLIKSPTQKVDFVLQILPKIGIGEDVLAALGTRIVSSAKASVRNQDQQPKNKQAAADVSDELEG